MSIRIATIVALATLTAEARPAAAIERPVVIELFTSQGCSSCPPAETLLSEYAGRTDVLPLGFHVTYWDRLGWRDPFSLQSATQRQAAYEGQLGSGTSFTPQMVIDGRYSVIGSRRDEVAAAVRKAAARSEAGTEVRLTRTAGALSIRIGSGSGSARILLVGFDRSQTTPIGRGENRGRTITQANVVRALRAIGTWSGKALDLREAAPAGQEAAVLLQAPDGLIVGAARIEAGV